MSTQINADTFKELKQRFVQYSDNLGKKILYQPTKRVDRIKNNPEIQTLITDMKKAFTGIGIGLAANQIGKPLQIFMIEFTCKKDNPAHTARYDLDLPSVPFQVFINPKITAVSKKKVSFWHGCLSALDNQKGLVSTYQWLEYEAYDEHGNYKKGRLDGMGAVIFQHEFRHLLGSLYIDHAKIFMSQEELQEMFTKNKSLAYKTADESVPLLLSDYIVGESIEAYAKRIKSIELSRTDGNR